MRLFTGALLILLAGCVAGPSPRPPGLALVTRQGSSLRTTHSIGLSPQASGDFRMAGPSHRHADFGGHPYLVSLAALLGSGEAVMLHGERVTDGSGASNYDDLPLADWPAGTYRLRGYCLEVSDAMVREEHDLGWLRSHGWDPQGLLAAEQYLRTSADHNEEVVITLLARVQSCGDADAVRTALRALRARVVVRSR